MQVILDDNEYSDIWHTIYQDFHFYPTTNIDAVPFRLPGEYAVFRLNRVWDDRQEQLVREIMLRMYGDCELYALDWQHDCFTYRPGEQIPIRYHYYDGGRDYNVYFPTYYPDGDYHFFLDKTLSSGLLGHPWQKKLYVLSGPLIDIVKEYAAALDLQKIEECRKRWWSRFIPGTRGK